MPPIAFVYKCFVGGHTFIKCKQNNRRNGRISSAENGCRTEAAEQIRTVRPGTAFLIRN